MARRVFAAAAVSLLWLCCACSPSDPATQPATARQPASSTPPAVSSEAGAPATVPIPPDAQAAAVVRHVDGDTVWVRARGRGSLSTRVDTKVRLLEVDAPELTSPRECFGPEAASVLGRLLPRGAVVQVAPDRELLDRYGRALLYVWTSDGGFVNEALVRQGYARAVVYGRNDRHIDRLRSAERQARAERRGLWGECPVAG